MVVVDPYAVESLFALRHEDLRQIDLVLLLLLLLLLDNHRCHEAKGIYTTRLETVSFIVPLFFAFTFLRVVLTLFDIYNLTLWSFNLFTALSSLPLT